MLKRVCVVGISFLFVVGCLAGEGSNDPLLGSTEVAEDAAPVQEDAETAATDGAEEAETNTCELPVDNLGVDPGNVLDLSATFKNCDGEDVTLLDLVCGAEAVLIDIGAGWCEPCKEEAEHLEEDIVQVFKDQGVVVISILTEDANSQPATQAFCQGWTEEYGLTSPVITDPKNSAKTWIKGDPTTSLPINIILNRDFVIENYLVGGQSSADLQAKINDVLED